MDERKSIATVHNLLFTVLTLGLLSAKAVLVSKGQSAVPHMLDWMYGITIALVQAMQLMKIDQTNVQIRFYWLGEYNKNYPLKHQWYFKKGLYCLMVDLQTKFL